MDANKETPTQNTYEQTKTRKSPYFVMCIVLMSIMLFIGVYIGQVTNNNNNVSDNKSIPAKKEAIPETPTERGGRTHIDSKSNGSYPKSDANKPTAVKRLLSNNLVEIPDDKITCKNNITYTFEPLTDDLAYTPFVFKNCKDRYALILPQGYRFSDKDPMLGLYWGDGTRPKDNVNIYENILNVNVSEDLMDGISLLDVVKKENQKLQSDISSPQNPETKATTAGSDYKKIDFKDPSIEGYKLPTLIVESPFHINIQTYIIDTKKDHGYAKITVISGNNSGRYPITTSIESAIKNIILTKQTY